MSVQNLPLPTTAATTSPLRRLHAARAAFAVAWAVLLATAGTELGALATVFLVLYPLVDAVASLVDTRTTREHGTRVVTLVNTAVSLAAAIGLAFAATGDVVDVLVVWGSWAVVSGLLQLAGALRRRSVGGQRFLMASGTISVLAGASFVVTASDATSAVGLAGYALLGGIFFLVSAVRLGATARAGRTAEV